MLVEIPDWLLEEIWPLEALTPEPPTTKQATQFLQEHPDLLTTIVQRLWVARNEQLLPKPSPH